RVIRQRIRHVDHDLAVEAGVADALEDLLDGRAAGREDDDLAMLGRLFEAPGRGLPFHRSKPLRQALALWIPRADHHLMPAGRETASEGLPDVAAPQDADFHRRAKGRGPISGFGPLERPYRGPNARRQVVTYLSSARGRRGPWSRSSRWPWIKSEGMEVVRQLKKSFPGTTIVADLKTMDTGAFEVEIAAKAGADVVTVMGVTDDATILEAVKAARRYGAKIMVDLMRVPDKAARAKELEKLGVDYLNMHVSIDEQMIARTPLEELKGVASATSLPIAVAGGLNSETVAQAAAAGASILSVEGVVIDGAVRDLDTILELNFPCFSRHVAPHAGEPKGLGEIGSEIECGGQKVHAGDWIVGDESGILVVPQDQAVEMANRAVDVLERENRIREEIKRGGTLSSVLELEKWEQIR